MNLIWFKWILICCYNIINYINKINKRSYYRCTSSSCGVKKRVERSCEDPTTVVTTYEGTHAHPCPLTPRGSFALLPERPMLHAATRTSYGGPHYPHHHPQAMQHQHQPYFHNLFTTFTPPPSLFRPNLFQERPYYPSASSSPRDDGLLQDMLPSHMFKPLKDEEKKE